MQGEPNRWKLTGNRGANTFSSPLSARKGVVSLFLGGNRVTRLASLVVADLDPWKIHRSGSFEGATNTTPTVHSEISVCRFTPRRRRLVTSSRPPAPRVHARQTPLNFYSILLSPSSHSSIPSLAKLYTSPRRSYHDHVQTPSRFSLPNRQLQITTSFYSLFPQRSYHSPRLLTLARLPLDRHSWYHQRRVILSDNISEHTNNLFPFLFPRSFLSFLFILAPVHDRPSQRGKDRRELGGTKGGRES